MRRLNSKKVQRKFIASKDYEVLSGVVLPFYHSLIMNATSFIIKNLNVGILRKVRILRFLSEKV